MTINVILEKFLSGFFKSAGYDETIKVSVSNLTEPCDYQCNNIFGIAKKYGKNPIAVAEEVAEKIKGSKEFNNYFRDVSVAKPGFLNMTLSDKLINDQLNKMSNKEKFNFDLPETKTVFLDYGGANIAKPLHVGHLRSAILGESIKRINNFAGNKTIADVHLGDNGLQIGQVIYGLVQENVGPNAITLNILEKIYPKISSICKENSEVKAVCEEITLKMQQGDKKYLEYQEQIIKASLPEVYKLYSYLGAQFDLWLGEKDSFMFIPKAKEDLINKGLLKESEGAQVVFVDKETDKKPMPPLIFEKSNGGYTYAATDIGAIYQRMEENKPNEILYVVDIRQELHFEQVFRTMVRAGMNANTQFKFCGFGTVNGKDGKPFKTRAGNAPKLFELFEQVKAGFIKNSEGKTIAEEDLDIIVNAIIKFADMQNDRTKDYIFDIEKFSKTTGKTGPYILYTYLRINKMLKDYNVTGKFENIINADDRNLRLKLLKAENAYLLALHELKPNHIAEALYEICNYANVFYETNRLNKEENQNFVGEWVNLLALTKSLIAAFLDLLVIQVPSVM